MRIVVDQHNGAPTLMADGVPFAAILLDRRSVPSPGYVVHAYEAAHYGRGLLVRKERRHFASVSDAIAALSVTARSAGIAFEDRRSADDGERQGEETACARASAPPHPPRTRDRGLRSCPSL